MFPIDLQAVGESFSPKVIIERQQRLACINMANNFPHDDGKDVVKTAKEFYKFVEKGE